MQLLANLGVNASTRKDSFFIEPGLIVEWYGTAQTVPEGWALCNGQGGRPNLTDKFIIGASSNLSIGSTGGSANAVVVSHAHTGTTDTAPNHTHTHTHRIGSGSNSVNRAMFGSGTLYGELDIPFSANGAHTHTATDTSSVGESGVDKNLPPYYALFYIIKLGVE